MSLILEALRKSEAERQLGSAPGVLAPMPVLHAPAPRRRSWLAIAGVALALVAVALATWRLSGRATEMVEVPPPARTHAPPSASPTAAPAIEAPAPMPAPAMPAPLPQAAAIPPRTPESTPPTTPATPSNPPPSVVVPHPSAPVAPALLPHAPMPAESHPDPSLPRKDAGSAADPSSLAHANPQETPAPPAPPAADAEPTLLPVTALPPAERSALPTLKVSMHVYAEDPAQRFMIVDGNRVGEGDRLGHGVVLVRILRRGAEIDVGGRRLLLPNP